MKAIRVKGRNYRTDTSRLILETDTEALYRKRTGEFFLFFPEEANVVPLTFAQAEDWAKQNNFDFYSNLFTNVVNGEKKVQLKVYINPKTYMKIVNKASQSDMTFSDVVEKAVEKF